MPDITEDCESGEAAMLTYLRDLFTVSKRDNYDRADVLVLLETISRDPELFPRGYGILAWQEPVDELPT